MRIDLRQLGVGGLAAVLSPAAMRARIPLLAVTLIASPAVARAQGDSMGGFDIGAELRRQISDVNTTVSQEELAALSLFLGILFFAVLAAILYVRTRARLQLAERRAQERIGELGARVERAEGLLAVDQNVLVVWPPDGGDPEIRCEPGASHVLPSRRGEVLAFGRWLEAESALDLEKRILALRARGESFNVTLKTRGGAAAEPGFVEADGRSAGGRAVLRIRDLAGQRRELADISYRHKKLARDVEGLRSVLDVLPMPAWLSNAEGRLTWVNPAYARAVGKETGGAAIECGAELLDPTTRDRLETERAADGVAHRQMALAVAGAQRTHKVWDIAGERYRAGIAVDVSETESLRRQLARRDDTHARTLDLVSTAVAAFGPDQRLTYYNRKFGQLWGLDRGFLNAGPGFDEILDRLRAAGRIQEPADYRGWRADQLSIFTAGGDATAAETARRTLWHLPDGRSFSVVMTRQSDGSVSGLFEDVSQSIDLESRVVALTEVQRETLDSLDEGIAVFGTDGLLKLHNPAFSRIWKLSADRIAGQPHVEEVIEWCRDLHDDKAVWSSLRAVVTSLQDSREALSLRLERPDRSVIDLRAVPLPDGATLVVFTDVSDSARIEKALRDRNEALMTAGRIKNEFVHKVSYELRAPLTNIIGFAQLMSDGEPGAMSERQREYAGHILSSSSALLAIINDILDLATIDAGVMELDIGEVDIRDAVTAAAESLQDRLTASEIVIDLDVADDIGAIQADEKRIRQILFNLLSNAIGFSDPGQTVSLACRRDASGGISLCVRDQGPGIPDDVRRSVFDRFESYSLGTRHRGAGLGLSIVRSFVELHGGEVRLESALGRGTTVTCVLPARQPDQTSVPGTDAAGATIHELGRSARRQDAATGRTSGAGSTTPAGSAVYEG